MPISIARTVLGRRGEGRLCRGCLISGYPYQKGLVEICVVIAKKNGRAIHPLIDSDGVIDL